MDTFHALADPSRRIILQILARSGRLSATAISDRFRMSHPAVSQHLKILRSARLVTVEKKAQQRLYQINPERVHAIEVWAKKTVALWNERFDSLDKLLQAEKEAG